VYTNINLENIKEIIVWILDEGAYFVSGTFLCTEFKDFDVSLRTALLRRTSFSLLLDEEIKGRKGRRQHMLSARADMFINSTT
jgi:hypothetical protein